MRKAACQRLRQGLGSEHGQVSAQPCNERFDDAQVGRALAFGPRAQTLQSTLLALRLQRIDEQARVCHQMFALGARSPLVVLEPQP